MNTSIHAIDAAIIVVVPGRAHRRRRLLLAAAATLDEFFLARQSMTWLPVGLSLMAALDSAIDYLMQPSATISYGLILLVGTSRGCCCIRGSRTSRCRSTGA